MVKSSSFIALLLYSTSVFSADICTKTTDQLISENPKMQLDSTISKFGNEKNSKLFNVIKQNLIASIGKEPPYSVDTFMIFKGIDYQGQEVMTLSVEGDGCHRKYFVVDQTLLDYLKEDRSL